MTEQPPDERPPLPPLPDRPGKPVPDAVEPDNSAAEAALKALAAGKPLQGDEGKKK
jgi:hypothetical protein